MKRDRAAERKRRRERATVILFTALMEGPLSNAEAMRLMNENHISTNRQYASRMLAPAIKAGEIFAKLDSEGRRYWVLAVNDPDLM